jgi:glycosyltransferase involved in cell wall biosynthesis
MVESVVLRIALVGPLPPPAGGMANQTRQLAEFLVHDGIEVHVVQVNPPYRPAWVSRFRGLRALFRLPPYLLALWRAFGRCDVVHLMANSGGTWFLCAMPAILLGRLRGTPVVVNYRGGGAEAFLRRRAWAVRPVLALASALVVPSTFLQQVFARFGMRAEVLPNIVDLGRFTPASVPPPADAPHLIVTRNLEAIYDNATALRAFALVRAQLPGARMTIAGEGPLLEKLQALARQLGVSEGVTFSGRIDNAQIPTLYRSASVFVNPSRVDNMPNSILEALASGVPVVSTNVGGVPYVVEHERTALLVPPADPSAMAAAIVWLLHEPALRLRLVEAGRRTVRRYEWPNVRPQLFSLYARMTAAPARSGARIN